MTVDVTVHPQSGAVTIRPGVRSFEGGKVTGRFEKLAEDLLLRRKDLYEKLALPWGPGDRDHGIGPRRNRGRGAGHLGSAAFAPPGGLGAERRPGAKGRHGFAKCLAAQSLRDSR